MARVVAVAIALFSFCTINSTSSRRKRENPRSLLLSFLNFVFSRRSLSCLSLCKFDSLPCYLISFANSFFNCFFYLPAASFGLVDITQSQLAGAAPSSFSTAAATGHVCGPCTFCADETSPIEFLPFDLSSVGRVDLNDSYTFDHRAYQYYLNACGGEPTHLFPALSQPGSAA